jgi:hypothetical protein
MGDRLTWRRQPNETGLARVCQHERGAELRLNGDIVGHVAPVIGNFRTTVGWYWYARADGPKLIPLCNTHAQPVSTMDAAKADCEAYVRERLGMPKPKRRGPVATRRA